MVTCAPLPGPQEYELSTIANRMVLNQKTSLNPPSQFTLSPCNQIITKDVHTMEESKRSRPLCLDDDGRRLLLKKQDGLFPHAELLAWRGSATSAPLEFPRNGVRMKEIYMDCVGLPKSISGFYQDPEHIVLFSQEQYEQADFDSWPRFFEKAVAATLLHSSRRD